MGDSASFWILLGGCVVPPWPLQGILSLDKFLCTFTVSGDSRVRHLASGPGSKLVGVSLSEDAGVCSCTLSPFILTVVLGFISQCGQTY